MSTYLQLKVDACLWCDGEDDDGRYGWTCAPQRYDFDPHFLISDYVCSPCMSKYDRSADFLEDRFLHVGEGVGLALKYAHELGDEECERVREKARQIFIGELRAENPRGNKAPASDT